MCLEEHGDLGGHKPTPATPEMTRPTLQRQPKRMPHQCLQFVRLIDKLSTVLSKDPESDALVLGRMKLSIATLEGQEKTISIEPEVYRSAQTVTEFFTVMAKYWNCYDDHDLLKMVIESTRNEEAISVLNDFLQNRDRGVTMPTEKCPEAPFKSPCQGNSSDSRPKDLTAGAPSEIPACKIDDGKKDKENAREVQIPSEQPTSLQSSSTQPQCVDIDLIPQCEISQQNNIIMVEEPVTQQPKQSSAPNPESSECLQCFHFHAGCCNKLPSNRASLIAKVDCQQMASWMYSCVKNVVATVTGAPKPAMSLHGVYEGSCMIVWHVSIEIAAVIKKIQLSQDDQGMLLQCAVLTLSCDDKCLFEIAREELVSVCVWVGGWVGERKHILGKVHSRYSVCV